MRNLAEAVGKGGGMRIRHWAGEVAVDAPAKVNLFFEVLGQRPDGYHEIETLMCPIDLYDTLRFREHSDGQLELRCERVTRSAVAGRAEPVQVPEGPDNLVLRAATLLRRRAGVGRGARMWLVKRIPTSAGLGGGSSDAAAALAAANLGWGLGWSREALAELAAELGSDVPFFLAGGPAICRGRGERVEPVSGATMLHFVVVRPPEGLSTAAVYSVCRPADARRSVAATAEAVRRGDLPALAALLHNRLEAAARSLSPWPERLREALGRMDFLGGGMSGSGTSWFGLCRHARHARRLARHLDAVGLGSVFAVRSCL
jgi:4-diphosphocytidyl-2-C-methyl-D-erythritol kinase